jgi:hypothetical protein
MRDHRIETARAFLHDLRSDRPLLREDLNTIDELLDELEAFRPKPTTNVRAGRAVVGKPALGQVEMGGDDD